MAKNRWIQSPKNVFILMLLCILLSGTMAACTKTDLPGGKKDMIQIHTEYCDLYYPSHWGENIKILQIEDTVQFRAAMEGYGLLPLVDIHFNSEEGSFYGMIADEDGRKVSVSLTVYPIGPNENWSQEQLDMLYGMQEDVNSLLSELPMVVSESAKTQEEQQTSERKETSASLLPSVPETASESNQAQEKQQTYGEIAIATPYGVLRYPDTWNGYLRLNEIEADVYTVEFYANVGGHPELHLFDIQIGSTLENGIVLDTANGETIALHIAVLLEELDQTWEEEDADIIYGMLDDINYMLDNLEITAAN